MPEPNGVSAREAGGFGAPLDAELRFDALQAAPIAEPAQGGAEVDVELVELEVWELSLQDGQVETAAEEGDDGAEVADGVREIGQVLAFYERLVFDAVVDADDGCRIVAGAAGGVSGAAFCSSPPPHMLAERPTSAIAAAAATIINFRMLSSPL